MEYLYPLASLIFFAVTSRKVIDVSEAFRNSNYSIKIFLRSSGKYDASFLRSIKNISKTLGFILFIPASLDDSFMTVYHLFITSIFALDLFIFIRNYKKIDVSDFFRKDIYIFIPTIIFIFLLYLNPLIDIYFWLFLLERASIFFYLFFAFCLSFPFELYEDTQVEKMKKIKSLHTSLLSVVISGKESKILMDHMHALLDDMRIKVAKIYIDKTIRGLTNFLLSSIKNNIEIALVGISYSSKNIEQIVEIMHPEIIVRPFNDRASHLFRTMHSLRISMQNNLDDPKIKKNGGIKQNEKNAVIRFSRIEEGQIFRSNKEFSIFISGLKVTREGIAFQLIFDKKQYAVQTGILGIEEAIGMLPAVLIAIKTGINLKEIVRVLSKLKPLKGYMYPYTLLSKSRIVDYSSAYLDSIDSVLSYLSLYDKKKILYLNSRLLENEPAAKVQRFLSRIAEVCNYCIIFNNPSTLLIGKYTKSNLNHCKIVAMDDFELINFLIKNLKTDDDIAIGLGSEAGIIISKLLYRLSVDLSN